MFFPMLTFAVSESFTAVAVRYALVIVSKDIPDACSKLKFDTHIISAMFIALPPVVPTRMPASLRMVFALLVCLDICDAKLEGKHDHGEDQYEQTYAELLHGLGKLRFFTLCQSRMLSISGDLPLLLHLNFAAQDLFIK